MLGTTLVACRRCCVVSADSEDSDDVTLPNAASPHMDIDLESKVMDQGKVYVVTGRKARSSQKSNYPRKLESEADTHRVIECYEQFKSRLMNPKAKAGKQHYNSKQKVARRWFRLNDPKYRKEKLNRFIKAKTKCSLPEVMIVFCVGHITFFRSRLL